MKRLASAALAFCCTILLFAPSVSAAGLIRQSTQAARLPAYSRSDLQKLPSMPAFDDDFLPAGSGWRALAATEPAKRMNASVQLADGVLEVGKPVTDSLADAGQVLSGSTVQKQLPGRIVEQGGYIARSVLDAAAAQKGKSVANGTVVVDKDSGAAFKVVSPTVYTGIFDSNPDLKALVQPLEATYAVTKPTLKEVVKSFDLPSQTIALTKGNVTGFAPNVETSALLGSGAVKLGGPGLPGAPAAGGNVRLAVDGADKRFKTLTGDNLIELKFEETPLNGKVGNSTISLTLAGGVAIGGIDLTGRYSANGGYEISMSLQQECYLVAELDAEIKEDIRVPLLAIDVPFGVGSVYGGIFAIIGMDGDIRLGIEARETSACRMGIEGDTFFYVPTSFHPIFEPTPPKITGDCSMLGKINGSIRFGPMLGIELFGFDLVGAGALLGAGVIVDSDGSMLDIELYASIDVYVVLLDEAFNLARARPTIYRKQQPDMHGYKVSFLETFVNPGRVGGLIEQEPKTAGAPYVSAVDLEYRVWIVPMAVAPTFTAADREARLQADRANAQKQLRDKVRTYPESGNARTNFEGEFFQADSQICFAGDQVYLEFKGDGKTFFVGPATPILPFTDVTITGADYFNDFITGKVEPKRLIRWESDRFNPDEPQQELVYYTGPIDIAPFNDYGFSRQDESTYTVHRPYVIEGTAYTGTNAQGEFDTRVSAPASGVAKATGAIDVLSEDTPAPVGVPAAALPGTVGVIASLKINDAVNNITVYGIVPSAPKFQFTRTREYVANSWKREADGDRIIDRMAYDEYLWIANPNGTRAITADMLQYAAEGFSTQDYKGYYENPVKATRDGPITLSPVLDDFGQPTGSALFAQRVTVEWVWQAHPNPIRITSANHATVAAGQASAFTVTASGWFPRFSLKNPPAGISIDEKTGVLTLPATLAPGTYAFTIHAQEGIVMLPINAPDPKLGNDASKPDEQAFTLTVTTDPVPSVSPTPGLTPTPAPTAGASVTPGPSPTPAPRTPPRLSGRTSLDMTRLVADLVTTYSATGSQPITFAVSAVSATGAPVGGAMIGIHPATGLLTVAKSIAAGLYTLTITASNDAGKATLNCTLRVVNPTAPVFEKRRDNYQFSMTRGSNFTMQLTATGTAPITYALEQVNERLTIPAQITIDSATGQLSVDGALIGGIQAGTYDFNVRATNAAGSAVQACRLEVAPFIPPTIRPPLPNLSADGMTLLAVTKPGTTPGTDLPPTKMQPNLFQTQPPPNRLTLRCDDARDVYTHDRDSLNGAAFIAWDATVKLALAEVMVDTSKAGVYSDYKFYEVVTFGDTYEDRDPSPVCENYHYDHPEAIKPTMPLTEEQRAAIRANIEKALKAEMMQYKNGYQDSRRLDAGGLRDAYMNFRANPTKSAVSSLEYGALVKEIGSGKAGRFEVALTPDTGTVVAGEYFASLQGNRQAEITFRQAGAAITFAGRDLQAGAPGTGSAAGPAGAGPAGAGAVAATASGLINIGLTGAPHAQSMLDAAGSGAQSFTYGFQHHGSLPGLATFAIATPLAAGSTVNVYRFDAAANQFTLIAGNIKVGAGGTVTYKNNTMSEYIITTRTFANAAVSPVAGLQGTTPGSGAGQGGFGAWPIMAAAGFAVLILAIAAWLLMRRRLQRRLPGRQAEQP